MPSSAATAGSTVPSGSLIGRSGGSFVDVDAARRHQLGVVLGGAEHAVVDELGGERGALVGGDDAR